MTKLAIMSDLHIDLNHFDDFEIQTLIDTLSAEKISHLHFAGDISNHFYDISYSFLETMSKHFDVTYNLGNHDMLDLDDKVIDDLDFKLFRWGKRHSWLFMVGMIIPFSQKNLKLKQSNLKILLV